MTAAFPTSLIAAFGLWLFNTLELQGQNLVFNPSFELIDSCPPYPNSLGYQDGAAPTGWWRWSDTPDYFNACATDTIGDVPGNLFGYQPAYDGEAYSGFYAYWGDAESFREMIGTQLPAPLVPGITYYASMRVSPGYGGYYGFCGFSNRMGMLFTMDPYVGGWMNPSYPLRNYSQVSQPVIVPDTTGWTLVSGSFVADSAYQYVVIGNHHDNANTDTSTCGSGMVNYATYYYVDQVCVSTDPLGCPVETGLAGHMLTSILIAPNPTSGSISISGIPPIIQRAMVLDAFGRCVADRSCCTHAVMDVSHLAEGTYVLVLMDSGGNYVARSRFVMQ